MTDQNDFEAAWMAAARREAALARDWTGAGASPPDNYERSSSSQRGARRGASAGPAAIGVHNPAIPGTRAFTLEAVGPGWILYSRWEPLDAAGVVVDVTHHTDTDPDTGEISPRTVYRLLAYWKPSNPWRRLDAAGVDLTQLGGVDRMTASAAVRWLVKPLTLRRRRNQLTATEIENVHDAWRLAAAVAL